MLCGQVGFGQHFYGLIERAVAGNGDQPATIVAHSLGCLVSLYFLSRQEPAWLERHVGSLIAISGPWAGAVSGLKGALLNRAPTVCTILLGASMSH